MDWMYRNCSATAQHGALKWRPIFKASALPVFEKLYRSVKTGRETAEVIRDCGRKDYQKFLEKRLGELHNSEMWRAGAAVRSLRPREQAKAIGKAMKGVGGRKGN